MRKFETGATRNSDTSKFDYEGFLSPAVLERFGAYMHKHRTQADGNFRDSDNWQKGMPKTQYMKSLIRHTIDLWRAHRGYIVIDKDSGERVTKEELLCAIIFNAQGYLFEMLRKRKRQ